MTNLRILSRSAYLSVALGLIATIIMPLVSVATAAAECLPPPDPGPGIHHPVGSDAAAFTYICDGPNAGLWLSAHYTYHPDTGLTTANDPLQYVYNSGTKSYDLTTWVYDAPTNRYIAYTKSVTSPPAGATVIGAPVPIAATGGNSINNTGAGSNNTINNNGGVTSGSSINGTGPSSNNTIGGTANNTLNGNNNTTAALNNGIVATAGTGNALTIGNTTAGGASSGNAQDIANVVNLLQSSSNALDGNTVTFVANIDGNVNGDLLFDPAQIGSLQPAGVTSPTTGTNNLTINNKLDAGINNTIDLTAKSGDATVSGNTSGGDATSGTAATIANVVNLINSAITSGKSFLGVININGNLNGDILVPPDFIDQLVAANVPTVTISTTGPGSNNSINTETGSNNTKVTNTNNQGITNNVDASANSGKATVSENTQAGGATSGSASTNITAFNLTGSNVIGRNSLLVFVNVVGTWVGLIVNAPAGATAAELGGGITTENNTQANSNTTIDNNTNQKINNNIRTAANSGDATVSRNTKGGNAKSGNAKGAVNLLNVENSSLSLSGWFGILFINVFGTWHGSFGVNTSAGDPVAAAPGGAAGGGSAGAASFAPAQFASFLPKKGNAQFTITGGANGLPQASSTSNAPTTNATAAVNAVLAASNTKLGAPQPTLEQNQSNFRRTAAIIGTCVLLFIIGDAYVSRRRSLKV